jgi:hypothetical protein
VAATLRAVAQPVAAYAATGCSGPDPAIQGLSVKNVSTQGGLASYQVSGKVVNAGTSQGGDVLQFVNIYLNGAKLDAKSVPPLKVGDSYPFTYVYQRSVQAGSGTTKLDFELDITRPAQPPGQNCAGSRESIAF